MTRQTITAEGDDREKTAAMRLVVSANSWTGAELRSLPRGGTIQIDMQSNGPVRVLLADTDSYKSFPKVDMAALFDRQIETSMVAEVTLPRGGDYYLIADNRSSATPREVLLRLRGRAHDAAKGMGLSGQLVVLQQRMDEAFDLHGLKLQLDDPGNAGPTITGRTLNVGREFIKHLESEIPDKDTTRGSVLFAIMHCIASDWLTSGKAPSTVQAADLAAALMILFNQLDAARGQAAYFAVRKSMSGPLDQAIANPAHPLSPVVAQSVQRRLEEPQKLLHDMQEVILSRMRSKMLQQLRKEAPGWADPEKVSAALATAGAAMQDDREFE